MTAVILIGGIDLSVGSVLAFSMMMMGWFSHNAGLPLVPSVFLGIATGALCGMITGFLITVAKLPPFIATLAMMSILRGAANIITGGFQIIGYPASFTNLSTVRHFGFVSVTVAAFIVLSVLSWIYLRFRAGGRVVPA